jgi:uncharacterized 2Fe-2S/4Fe-4S cluster protein (DUF4445 family)
MPFRVRILPNDVVVFAEQGELLSKVIQRADLSFETECGGQGTCGECAVSVVEGACGNEHEWTLSDDWSAIRNILACLAEICGDVTVKLSQRYHVYVPTASDSPTSTTWNDFGISELSPLTRKIVLSVPEPGIQSNTSDLDRLMAAIAGDSAQDFSLSALQELPQAIRQSSGLVTVTVAERTQGDRVFRIESGDTSGRHYGLACDIGTTTVAVRLVDLKTGHILGTAATYNDQISCGADVISRIIYSQKAGHLDELRNRVVCTINKLIDSLGQSCKIVPDDIYSAVLSGNTTMTHLILGIDPRFIREAPYSPVVTVLPILSARELGIHIHSEAACFFSPCVGSYVGGDITAGLLCLAQKRKDHGAELFIDVGTNGELVIRGNDWMIGCACSAGPAFEGVGIRCGMRAADGAIYSIDVGGDGKEIVWKSLGTGLPSGICGSGLIDLVAGLLASGVVGRDGRFSVEKHTRFERAGNRLEFVVVDGAASSNGENITISEADITNIMRAKAAIYSATSLLLKNVGLSCEALGKVYVAGGFGSHLNIENAIAIGLFPDIARDRFEYLGNTSLQGSYLALISPESRKRLSEISKYMTYIDLSSEPRYMDEYMAALFLPHTNEDLFPSTRREAIK